MANNTTIRQAEEMHVAKAEISRIDKSIASLISRNFTLSEKLRIEKQLEDGKFRLSDILL